LVYLFSYLVKQSSIKFVKTCRIFRFVSADPLTAGSVAGNLASGIVPDAN